MSPNTELKKRAKTEVKTPKKVERRNTGILSRVLFEGYASSPPKDQEAVTPQKSMTLAEK